MAEKRRSKRILILLTAICVSAPAVFCFGPSLIHACHRVGTTESERQINKERYHELARQESSKSTSSQERSRVSEERWRLYHWFHARGWPIDEGWHDTAFGKKRRAWRALFNYWRDGSNRAETSRPETMVLKPSGLFLQALLLQNMLAPGAHPKVQITQPPP